MHTETRSFRFYKADVFTDVPFGGNPVAIIPDGHQFSDREFQQIAREMNLSETVFVLPPTDATTAVAKLRIFTPTQEIPFAGHPILGTFYVLATLQWFSLREPVTHVSYECNIGNFSVDIFVQNGKIDRLVMSQPAPQFLGTVEDMRELYEIGNALGLTKDAIATSLFPIEVVSTGLPMVIVPVRSLTAVKSISVNPTAVTEICERLGANGIMAFSTMTVEDLSDVHTRVFACPIGITEDPATGSASGALGGYLVKNGVVEVGPTTEIVAEQGYEIDRPSHIIIQVLSDDDMIQEIKVGGEVVMVAEGTMVY
ncbi:MAG: PhzF family phenazine biosynthesis isomerase [Nitrospirales bacterium]|nr:PhzF family phenazine biosynthesis isomerase [Nitrospirales bacterium]